MLPAIKDRLRRNSIPRSRCKCHRLQLVDFVDVLKALVIPLQSKPYKSALAVSLERRYYAAVQWLDPSGEVRGKKLDTNMGVICGVMLVRWRMIAEEQNIAPLTSHVFV
jgi:hypothetical protein